MQLKHLARDTLLDTLHAWENGQVSWNEAAFSDTRSIHTSQGSVELLRRVMPGLVVIADFRERFLLHHSRAMSRAACLWHEITNGWEGGSSRNRLNGVARSTTFSLVPILGDTLSGWDRIVIELQELRNRWGLWELHYEGVGQASKVRRRQIQWVNPEEDVYYVEPTRLMTWEGGSVMPAAQLQMIVRVHSDLKDCFDTRTLIVQPTGVLMNFPTGIMNILVGSQVVPFWRFHDMPTDSLILEAASAPGENVELSLFPTAPPNMFRVPEKTLWVRRKTMACPRCGSDYLNPTCDEDVVRCYTCGHESYSTRGEVKGCLIGGLIMVGAVVALFGWLFKGCAP